LPDNLSSAITDRHIVKCHILYLIIQPIVDLTSRFNSVYNLFHTAV
jgi:hypothetical protein